MIEVDVDQLLEDVARRCKALGIDFTEEHRRFLKGTAARDYTNSSLHNAPASLCRTCLISCAHGAIASIERWLTIGLTCSTV